MTSYFIPFVSVVKKIDISDVRTPKPNQHYDVETSAELKHNCMQFQTSYPIQEADYELV